MRNRDAFALLFATTATFLSLLGCDNRVPSRSIVFTGLFSPEEQAINDCEYEEDWSACGHLAIDYYDGTYRAPDLLAARRLYTKACDHDILVACQNLGLMAKYGEGGPVDYQLALTLFERVCAVPDQPLDLQGKGCNMAALIYFYGQGTPANHDKAVSRLGIGCYSGYRTCCEVGANGYFSGEIPQMDPMKFLAFATKACELGQPGNCVAASISHRDGVGTPVDPVKAAYYKKLACQYGHEKACPSN